MADVQQNILINIDVESGEVNSQLDQIDQKINSLGGGVNLESFKSVRAAINAAREEAIRLAIAIEEAEAAGENVDALSARYTEVTQKAAQLRDAVDQTNDSIANANPDNRLQGLISVAQGAITAVQGVAGAFTILGVDAETANVALAKLQGLIALTDALGSINKIKDGYRDLTALINLSTIAQRASNVATVAATVVQRAFTGSVVATGTAFRVLRAALISTGIGALVVLIGTAVAALIAWKNSSDEAAASTERLKNELEDLEEAYQAEVDTINRSNRLVIAALKARGATELEIRQANINAQQRLLQQAQQREADIQAQIDDARRRGLTENYAEQRAALIQAQADVASARDAIRLEELAGIEEQTKKEREAAEERKNDAIKASEQATEKRKSDIRELEQFTQDARARDKNSRQRDLDTEIDEIEKKYQRALTLARLYRKDTVELERLRVQEIANVTNQSLIQGEQFALTEQLKFVEKEVESLARSIKESFAKNPIAEDLRAFLSFGGFDQEIQRVFSLGATLRKRQAEIERDARIQSASRLTFSRDPQEDDRIRSQITEIIKKDYQFAVRQIQDEIDNAQKSLEKGIEITLLEIDAADARARVDEVTRIFEQLLVPFRAIQNEITRTGPNIFGGYISQIRSVAQAQLFASGEAVKAINQEAAARELLIRSEQNFRLRGEEMVRQDFIRNREETQRQIDERKALGANVLAEQAALNEDELASLTAFENAKSKIQKDADDKRTLQRKITQVEQSLEAQNQARLQKVIFQETQKELNLISLSAGQRSFARNFLQSEESGFVKSFDNLILSTRTYYNALREAENAEYARRITDANFNAEQIETIEREHKARLTQIERDYQSDIIDINQVTLDARLQILDLAGQALGSLSQLLGQNTKAGKIAALAEIAIGTATGFIRGLNIAQQSSQAAGPGAAFAFPIFYAQQIAAVLAAANRAKQILAPVQGGGGDTSSTTPPQSPQAINSNVFRLPPEAQNVRVVNQQQNVVRAFITNEDLRTAQEKQAFLNKLSSF
jgi:hypothetical protein